MSIAEGLTSEEQEDLINTTLECYGVTECKENVLAMIKCGASVLDVLNLIEEAWSSGSQTGMKAVIGISDSTILQAYLRLQAEYEDLMVRFGDQL